MKKKEEELDKTKTELDKTEKLRKELEEQNVGLLQAKNDLYIQLQAEQDNLCDAEEKIEKLITQKVEYEQQIKEMEERLLDEEDANAEVEEKRKKMEAENKTLKEDIEDLENTLAKVNTNIKLFLCKISSCITLYNRGTCHLTKNIDESKSSIMFYCRILFMGNFARAYRCKRGVSEIRKFKN